MKQVILRRGEVAVVDVPAPTVEPLTLLVRLDHSCISAGTEANQIKASGTRLWRRAVQQPQQIGTLIGLAASEGIEVARGVVAGKLAESQPVGYSAAGVVLAVGTGIDDLRPGDRVACAGAEWAHHAEIIRVPRNLTVPVPPNVSLAHASTVTLGAIALQGVRRAQPTLGETFVVIGLGLVGQLTVQLLRANGCRVIGTDVNPAMVALARDLGMDRALDPEASLDATQVARLTSGAGADGVIITAATASDEVVAMAFRMCRKKGRVVLVGDVGLDLDRADFYEKEIDLLISTSYGPGRYDPAYEQRGIDYPVGYVRWTENRNMAEYLQLVSDGRVALDPLIAGIYPLAQAPAAFEAQRSRDARPPIVLLSYPDSPAQAQPVVYRRTRAASAGAIRVGVIGAGAFATRVRLPHMRSMPSDFRVHAIAGRRGHHARGVADQFDAAYATTEHLRVLEDPDVDLVLIATRHNQHGALVLEALHHGKHVLVEKPLALTSDELDAIVGFFDSRDDSGGPLLLTGFNRRFSRHIGRIGALTGDRSNPMVLNYRMNAGHVPHDHWTHTEQGGGRNRGEACHVYDVLTYLTGAAVVDVVARTLHPPHGHYSAHDNFAATVEFDDGSLATVTYTSLGSPSFSKEQLDVFVDGTVISLDDYRKLTVSGTGRKGLATRTVDKGHPQMLVALAGAIRGETEWPIPLWQQVQSTRIALSVEPYLSSTDG